MIKRRTARLLALFTALCVAHVASAAELSNAEQIDAFLDRAVAETHIPASSQSSSIGTRFCIAAR